MVEQNDGFDHPMGNLGDDGSPHPLRAQAVRRLGHHQPVQLPVGAERRPFGRRTRGRQHGRLQAIQRCAPVWCLLTQAMRDGGVPKGVFNMVAGPGETVGAELQENDDIDGIVFTGSFEVGFDLYKHFAKRYPKPVIVEMGGKNPTIVSKTADLDEAADGVMRGAFGFGGQKCSANSRVYVERPVYDEFVQMLAEKAKAIKVGDPVDRANWMGPIINQRALARYENAVAEAQTRRTSRGRRRAPDRRATSSQGYFVAPTVVADLPHQPPPVPRRAVRAVRRRRAGRFGRRGARPRQRQRLRPDRRLLQRGRGRASRSSSTAIEAGVVYVNRRAGATTGAWPGVQPFGGWKGSTARPARPAAACTTSSSSCASSRRPSSTRHARLRRHVARKERAPLTLRRLARHGDAARRPASARR